LITAKEVTGTFLASSFANFMTAGSNSSLQST
jgi:hypothetical protein